MGGNFGCHKCGKNFKQSAHLEKHLNRKFACDEKFNIFGDEKKDPDEIEKERKYKFHCDECEKSFTRKSNLIYHKENSCKAKKNNFSDKDEKIKKLEEENLRLKNLEKEMIEIKKNINELKNNSTSNKNITKNSHNNNNSHNNTKINSENINQQNVFLNNYTGSGMPQLTPEQIEPLLKRGFQTPVELTRAIHFNPNFPEYHNVYLPRVNEKSAMIFVDGNWKTTDRDDIIENIYENKRSFVLENLDKYINKIEAPKQKSLKRWLDTKDNNDEAIINTKKDIQRLLYDNRHMAIDRKKELEKQNKQNPKNHKMEIIKKIIEKKEKSESEFDSDSDSSYISNYSYIHSSDVECQK
jgi:hypothetical protein